MGSTSTGLALLACLGTLAARAWSQEFSIPWWTIESGGLVSGGDFQLRSAIGQPDASDPMLGGVFQLTGGFITPLGSTCPADLDDGTATGARDGAVTIDDLLYFLDRFGEGATQADLDDDGQDPPQPDGGVTIEDLLFFLGHFQEGC